ncbi:MAG: RDD family protein [Ahniella sp.]|nr:RDD family protein [Ahniella sp.]
MSEEAIWYYSNASKQPNGPMPVAQLREAMFAPGWYERALVWRDGWPQWRPWKEVAAELGIELPSPAEVTAPPPAPAPAAAPVAAAAPIAPPARPSAPAAAPMAATQPYTPSRSAPAPAGPRGAIPESEMVYAGFWRRLIAMMADSFLLSIIITPIIAIASAIAIPMLAGSGNSPPNGTALMLFMVVLYGSIFLISVGYFVLLERSAAGATIGKRLMGIRVVDKNGERIGFGRALGRFFAKILSSLPANLGYLIAAFTGRKQALHDFVAGTLVIDKATRSELGAKSSSVNIGVLIGVMAVVGIIGIGFVGILAAIALPAYQDYTVRAKVAGVIAESSAIKYMVAEHYLSNDNQCPGNGDGMIGSADSYFGMNYSRAEVLPGQDGNGTPFCLINLTLSNTGNTSLDGQVVQLAMDTSMQWTCASDSVPAKISAGQLQAIGIDYTVTVPISGGCFIRNRKSPQAILHSRGACGFLLRDRESWPKHSKSPT